MGGRRGRARGCGVPAGAPGVVVADSGPSALTRVRELLASHRVWERFTAGA